MHIQQLILSDCALVVRVVRRVLVAPARVVPDARDAQLELAGSAATTTTTTTSTIMRGFVQLG